MKFEILSEKFVAKSVVGQPEWMMWVGSDYGSV